MPKRKRVREKEVFETLRPFNSRAPLTVVRVDDKGTLGVIDDDTLRVWV